VADEANDTMTHPADAAPRRVKRDDPIRADVNRAQRQLQRGVDAIASREKLAPEAARMKLLGEKQPSLEFATPEQMGAAALFLCSPAAAQIRGIALPVDGGWTGQ
jgi:NAD(P)-dependent dehydrogenase (short-subunit alcohol dehydrogenase family)